MKTRRGLDSTSQSSVRTQEIELAVTSKPTILLIDDDRELFELMKDVFAQRGLGLAVAHDGQTGLALVMSEKYDLVLLDVMLPKMDGLSVLTQVRQKNDIPIIMLTAKGTPSDRVAGLEAGADDYLPKPFGPDELFARIGAVLRRTQRMKQSPDEVLLVNGIRVEPGRRQIWSGDQLIETTTIEYDILEFLIRSAGRTVSRDELSLALYQRPAFPLDRSLDVHVSHLRRKLGIRGEFIRTVRGTGYLFCTEGDKS